MRSIRRKGYPSSLFYFIFLISLVNSPKALSSESEEECEESFASTPIDNLNLSFDVRSALKRAGIETVEVLITKTKKELLKIPGIGKRAVDDIEIATWGSKFKKSKTSSRSLFGGRDIQQLSDEELKSVLIFSLGAMVEQLPDKELRELSRTLSSTVGDSSVSSARLTENQEYSEVNSLQDKPQDVQYEEESLSGDEEMSFEEAMEFMRKEGIKTKGQFYRWLASGRRPKNFPKNPKVAYRDKWEGWRRFLGTAKPPREIKWMSDKEARTLLLKERIITEEQLRRWITSIRRPENFPHRPDLVYKWESLAQFLGTDKRMPYQEAKTLVRSKNISSEKELEKWMFSEDRPDNFPLDLAEAYGEEWEGVELFLDVKKQMSYQEAKAFIRSKGMNKNRFKKWVLSSDRPENFPLNPPETYKEEWEGWGEFLGTNEPEDIDDGEAMEKDNIIPLEEELAEQTVSKDNPQASFPKQEDVSEDKGESLGIDDTEGTETVSFIKRVIITIQNFFKK